MHCFLESGSRGSGKAARQDAQTAVVSYSLFLICAAVVFYGFTEGLGSILTLASGIQLLGFLMLLLKVRCHGSGNGISLKMLGMYAATLVIRLCSTLQCEGYLPSDSTGDWLYQCIEILSLACAAWLFWKIARVRQMTLGGEAQNDQDSMPGLLWIALVCLAFGVAFHLDMNNDPFYDKVWTCACYLESVAMLPQLWMMTKAGNEVEALTGHFVMLSTVSRAMCFYFWYLDYTMQGFSLFHFERENYQEQFVVGVHILQIVLSLDFVVLYFKSFGKNTLLSHTGPQSLWL